MKERLLALESERKLAREIIYDGPGRLFAEFATAILEVSGPNGYTVDGVSRKGLVSDEIVHLVVQFESKEASDILGSLDITVGQCCVITTRAPQRDSEGMGARRKPAAKLFAQGGAPADVAREPDVSRQSVSRRHAAWSRGELEELRGAGRAGRRPLLDSADLAKVQKVLRRGPRGFGIRHGHLETVEVHRAHRDTDRCLLFTRATPGGSGQRGAGAPARDPACARAQR